MDSTTFRTLSAISRSQIFESPAYCRRAEKQEHFNVELPPLQLLVSNPSKLLVLYQTLTDNSSKALEVKINRYLMNEAECKSVFLMHLLPSTEEVVVQTLGTEELENDMRFSLSKSIMNDLIQYENQCMTCSETLECGISKVFKEMFKDLRYRIIAVPILHRQKYYPCSVRRMHPLFLTCFIDSSKSEDYLIKIAAELFKYCLPILCNIMEAEKEAKLKQMGQSLLTTVRNIFLNLEDFNKLIQTIIEETRKVTRSKKSTLYLTNSDQVALISKTFKCVNTENYGVRLKVAKDHAIPNYVTTTGKLLNINNTSGHPLIKKASNEATDFEIKNILCFPIKNESQIVGAVELCNKRKGNFNCFDEQAVNSLAIFCGAAILHSFKYTTNKIVNIKSHLCDKLMLRYIEVNDEEVEKKLNCPLIHSRQHFDDFSFSPRDIAHVETECFVLKMCEELGFFSEFPITKKVFAKFIMCVKQGCHNVPHHNWLHLFSTAHFAYLCLKNLKLVEKGYLTNTEALVYFISCLCHDVDYRGTINPFQQENCILASLYSSAGSIRERHSLSQILRILNMEGCNFLEYFDCGTYTLIVDLMKDFILATDLATHFKFYGKQYNMFRYGFDKNNPEHKYLFSSLLVTCADLSDHTKDWSVMKKVALSMYEELLIPHNTEKSEANPAATNPLEPSFLADLQIDFLKHISLPAFKLLSIKFSSLKELVDQIKQNIMYWECSKHIFQKGVDEGRVCTEMLTTEEFDKDIEHTMHLLKNGEEA